MRSDIDVVVLVCRINNSSWGSLDDCDRRSSWNCDNDDFCERDRKSWCRDNYVGSVVVENSSSKRIRKGMPWAKAFEELLEDGYYLVNSSVINKNFGQIVYTLAKYPYHPSKQQMSKFDNTELNNDEFDNDQYNNCQCDDGYNSDQSNNYEFDDCNIENY